MNKLYAILFSILILSMVSVYAEPVKITNQGEAYGHHGQCSGWNGCGSAEQCALAACKVNGFDTLVSYGEQKPCTQFGMCHLFNSINGEVPSIDCGWGNSCQVLGVTDIWCDNGKYTGTCSRELPPQIDPPEGGDVPEFGLLGLGILVVGVAGFFIWRRKR